MARRAFVFDPPDRFVAGTIGEPGSRTFFLQARDGSRVVSVVLEKTQVAVLADRLGRLLLELEQRGIAEPAPSAGGEDSAPLDEPLNEAFRAGTLTLGWDGERESVLIEARARTEDDDEPEAFESIDELDDDPDGPDLFRVRIDASAARSFVARALRIVRSGRPPCPLCGNPLDPQGHLCPRRNGQYVH
ncbi:MAG TPA: DUF3090 family protein [Candidatus Sulfomarinibacteraceae bacterium]|nr:DUF3090 family protein [Candidatus Sulfomarinibacteraceae bacterium]